MATTLAAVKSTLVKNAPYVIALGIGLVNGYVEHRREILHPKDIPDEYFVGRREAMVVKYLQSDREFYLGTIEELRGQIAARENQKNIKRDVGGGGQAEVGGLNVM